MTDLAARLMAAIEETERIARDTLGVNMRARMLGGEPAAPWRWREGSRTIVTESGSSTGHEVPVADTWAREGDHIIHHDPASVLRRCAADREQVGRYQSLVKIVNRLNERAAMGVATDLEIRNRAVQGIRLSESRMSINALASGYGITGENP